METMLNLGPNKFKFGICNQYLTRKMESVLFWPKFAQMANSTILFLVIDIDIGDQLSFIFLPLYVM